MARPFESRRSNRLLCSREIPPFDPETGPEYSRTHALWLAELCRLFYRQDVEEVMFPPQPARASFLAKAGLKQRAFFASADMDTHAMLVEPWPLLPLRPWYSGVPTAKGIMLPTWNAEYFPGIKTKQGFTRVSGKRLTQYGMRSRRNSPSLTALFSIRT